LGIWGGVPTKSGHGFPWRNVLDPVQFLLKEALKQGIREKLVPTNANGKAKK
jgi:hypothetical protein